MFKQNSILKVRELNFKESDINLHLIPKLVGTFKANPFPEEIIDIGTPERYKLANQYLLRMVDKHYYA
jgi:hypothetical protein